MVDVGRTALEFPDMLSGYEEVLCVEDDVNTAADVPKVVKTTRRKNHLLRVQGALKRAKQLRKQHECLEHAYRRATRCTRRENG